MDLSKPLMKPKISCQLNDCPCLDCICIPVCRYKIYRQLLKECVLVNRYITDRLYIKKAKAFKYLHDILKPEYWRLSKLDNNNKYAGDYYIETKARYSSG